MSKKEKSIELLNKAVSDELLAVNQYMYFHFRCDDYGYDLLSNLFKRTAIHEMVEMTPSGSVEKIHCVKEMLKKAAEMETGSVDDYNDWANECGANADSVTKKMFEALVGEEEVHLDQYETEIENLEKYGDNYLALQSIERSKSVATQMATPAAGE